MKLFLSVILFFFLNNCSFDNKTGIWKNEKDVLNNTNISENNIFKEFKKISISEEGYDKIIPINENFKISLPQTLNNTSWKEIYYAENNNYKNFQYSNYNKLTFKSKKITKNLASNFLLYENNNIITYDDKGNVIIFSINENKIITKYNFYKKRFKNIKKKLNFIVENNTIFIGDNLGYIYAFNYKLHKILWAKNYKVPFNSNLKILNNKIIISNQNNNLLFLDKNNGNLIKSIPTEEFVIKNNFINSLSVINDTIFFLNSFGTLYSVNDKDLKVNWFSNFNQSLDLVPSNLFFGNIIVNDEKIVIISSNTSTFLIEITTGSIIKKFNFSSYLKPIIMNDNVFFLTKNHFLVAINLNTENIIYSYDLKKIDNLNIKNFNKKIFKDMMVLNNELFIFLNNSYVLNFSIDGNFKDLFKLPSSIKTLPIFIEKSILYLNNKNKLIIVN